MLLLGKSEMLITHGDLFTPLDLKWRVFRKVIKPTLRDACAGLAADADQRRVAPSDADNLREAAFDTRPAAAQIVLDADRALVMANDAARRMFGLGLSDFGRPIQDLELSYRPIELRSHLDLLATRARASRSEPSLARTAAASGCSTCA